MKILIADNSRDVRERLAFLLHKNKEDTIMVNQAKNAVEMLDCIEMQKPDVVIFDIHIPGNGYKALQIIKKNKPSPVVIIYTNYSDSLIRRKCFELGADHFFSKYAEFHKIRILLKQLILDMNSSNV